MDVAHARDAQRENQNKRRAYYQQTFPAALVTQLLEQCGELQKREFSFCYAPFNKPASKAEEYEDIVAAKRNNQWTRFKSFPTSQALTGYLSRGNPLSINVGPVGFSPPILWRAFDKDRTAWGDADPIKQFSTEFVLDIDLKDYNELRTCTCAETVLRGSYCANCSEPFKASHGRGRECSCEWARFSNNICTECWPFAQAAMAILDYVLKQHWGIHEFFFVFSGGKGFHCWIVDPVLCNFSESERAELVSSLLVWTNERRSRLKYEDVIRDPLFDEDYDGFFKFLFDQLILTNEIFNVMHHHTRGRIKDYFAMIEYAPDDPLMLKLSEVCQECFENEYSALQTWTKLMDFNVQNNSPKLAKTIERRFIYGYLFPRIDVAVSTKIGHLRKLPFSPHAVSQCVTIPLLPPTIERIFTFEPSQCPSLDSIHEITQITDQFALELSLLDSVLDQVLYCEAEFPCVPELDELVKTPKVGTVFRELRGWLRANLPKHSLFYEITAYEEHCAHCTDCDGQVVHDRENTLLEMVKQNCWIEGSWKRPLEECMKLALYEMCAERGFFALPPPICERINNLMRQ